MRVDQASYRGWDGTARPSRGVALAIASTMVKRLMRMRIVRFLSWSVPLFASFVAILLFYTARTGQAFPKIQAALRAQGIEDFDWLALVNRVFFHSDTPVGFMALLMAALVGAPMIAEDRRSRSLPLYFSRPITHFDYVMGKVLTVLFFLSLLLIVPAIIMYLADIGMSGEEDVALEHLPTLVKSLVPNLALMAVLTALALGISSLTEKKNHAVLGLFGLMILLTILANVFAHETFDDASWLALSPYGCSKRIAFELLPVPRQLLGGGSHVGQLDLGLAWLGIAGWTTLGLAVLTARVRKVEVVT